MSITTKPAISIIVPVYNTGEILKDTLESILCQSFNNFELILVDDGSNEGTKKICDDYKEKDSRIKVIHKINGGICSARNTGLLVAKGEFVTFCDHDDLYEPEILFEEYEAITKTNSDMVIVGKECVSPSDRSCTGVDFLYNKSEINENFCEIVSQGLIDTIWNILYRKTILDNYLFDVEFRHGQEDINFNLKVIGRCDKIVSIKKMLYKHIIRDGFSTSSRLNIDLLYDLVKTNNAIYRVAKNLCNFESYDTNATYVKMQAGRMKMCLAYAAKVDIHYKEFVNLINSLEYYKQPLKYTKGVIPLKEKITFILVKKHAYRLLFLIYKMNSIVSGKNAY